MREQKVEEAALVGGLAEAVRPDETGSFRDDALPDPLATVRVSGPSSAFKAAAILVGLTRRMELSVEDYPDPIRAASDLAAGHEGDEKERALYVSRTAIRALADAYSKEESPS